MRLLICTQAVDLDDPVLGFFHGWLAEFSKRFEHIHVVCLKEGRHNLPKNVTVHSLGKPSFAKASQGNGNRSLPRFKYVSRFYRYIWSLRKEYEGVFAHMNQEYVLLGGKLWWLTGKRVALWRNHKKGSFLTRIACMLSHVVCYTSPEAFVAKYKNAVQMPIGIDTAQFPFVGERGDEHSILFLGRLDAVKNPDVFLEAMSILSREGVSAHADIYGDPTPGREEYARALKERFKDLRNVTFYSGVRNTETPALYGSHAVYVNLTPSGSFDKTIGEALACGSITITANAVVKDIVGELFVSDLTAEQVARTLQKAFELGDTAREQLRVQGRTYIERTHSLTLLLERLAHLYNK